MLNFETQAGGSERRIVIRRVSPPAVGPGVQIPQLDARHGGLDLVDAEISTDQGVVIFGFPAVNSHDAQVLGEIRVVRRAQSRIAESAEIFARKNEKHPISPIDPTRAPFRYSLPIACAASSMTRRS